MSEAIPKPKRHRWRWLAVIVPVLLVLLVYRPDTPKKLDQRLVGRWGHRSDRYSYTLRADGSGRWAEHLDGSGGGHNLAWWIDGDFLVLEQRADAFTNFTNKVENTVLRFARSVAPSQWRASIWNPDNARKTRCYFYLSRIDPQSVVYVNVAAPVPHPRLKTAPDNMLEVLTRQSQ